MIARFFSVALLSIFAENAVFARALGVEELFHIQRGRRLRFCTILTVILMISGAVSYFAAFLLEGSAYRYLLETPLYIICVGAVYVLFWLIFRKTKLFSQQFTQMQVTLSVFNTAVLGSILLGSRQDFTLFDMVAFGFGIGIGFYLAIFLLDEARERLEESSLPKAFKGFPAMAVYIGILSMVFLAIV